MTDWFENNDLFRRELAKRHAWATKVHARLVEAGVDASLTPMEWRTDIDDRHRFANEGDIRVPTDRGEFLGGSKSRNLAFTNDPRTYP